MRVAIIGGGITGSYIAWQLRKKGHKVTLFEQKTRQGKQACSGLISERIWAFIPENKSLIQNKINSSIIHIKEKDVKLSFKPQMLAFDRPALDRYVLGLALDANVRFVIEKIEELPDSFDRIIGCDGALSITRKILGLKSPKFRMGILCKIDEKDKSNSVETWPLKGGFAWRIPRKEYVEYGVLASVEKAKEEFLHFCIKQNIKPKRQHAALIPQGLVLSDNPKIALCGDAAGLTKPWTGGGVIWALTAAEILVNTFPDFEAYNRSLKRFFKPKLLASNIATKVGYFASTHTPKLLPKQRTIDSDFFPFSV
ncbi:FAD-dependent oxidoreductase [Candidatus Woesearchaeota archaeon]|nr:FAD-dependent oxidoreductase [Candidatus Woesearchaeota archaeon]